MDKSNIIVFSGNKQSTKADKILIRFVDVFLIADIEERKRQFEPLRIDIFDYVQRLKKLGSK